MRKSGLALLSVGFVLSGALAFASPPRSGASSNTTTTTLPASVCIHSSPTSTALICHHWRQLDTWFHTKPSILVDSFAPNEQVPNVVAYAAWIRTSTTDLALYPGYKGPGPTALDRGPEEVPLDGRGRLLATFNSGFYEADAAGGFYANKTLYDPMVDGLATVVRYTNGTVNITKWTGGTTPGPTIVMARQNLQLLVNNFRPTPATVDNQLWGLTLGGAPSVWRTALGIDTEGNLIYVAAPEQTSTSLAQIMVQLHVVRAMQLDINPEWPIFITYANRGAVGASLYVPNPNQIADRFLYPSTKDFFAVYISQRPGEAQPW
jgi:Phosphodiester glycosidase